MQSHERRTWSHLLQRVCEAHFQVFLSRLLCVACAHRHAWLMINERVWFLHNSTRTCVRSATLCGTSPFYVIFVRQLWRRFFKWKYFYFCFHISYVGFQTETNYWLVWGNFVCSRYQIIFLLCYCVEFCSLNASLWISTEFRLKGCGSTHSTIYHIGQYSIFRITKKYS